MHRRDHARRVPQVHRARRGARAPLPAGAGRGADRRRDDRDPARASRSATRSTTAEDHRRGAQGRRRAGRALRPRPLPARQGDRPDRRGRPAACACSAPATPPSLQGGDARAGVASEGEGSRRSRAQQYELRRRAARPRGRSCASKHRAAGAGLAGRARQRQARRHRRGHRRRSSRCGPASRSTRIAERGVRSGCSRWRTRCTSRVIGQDEAITTIAKAVRRARAGLKDPKRPIGVVHLPRPDRCRQDRAGAGAGRVHVRQRRRHDQDRHVGVHGAAQRARGWSVRLPATSATKRAASSPRPCAASRTAVILLDEIEKAHPEVFNMLLQIMDDGQPDRRQGPQGRLPQHDHHHDLATSAPTLIRRETRARLPQSRATRRRRAEQQYEQDEGQGAGQS